MNIVINKYQTFYQRFWAGFVDGLILLPIGIIDLVVFSKNDLFWLTVLWMPLSYSIYWLYSVLGHGWYGQTVGKHVMKVRVVDNLTESKITMRQAILRDIGLIAANTIALILDLAAFFNNDLLSSPIFVTTTIVLNYVSFAWFAVEIITCLFNQKRRAVHDFIAGTVVVRAE